jgi:Na+(H+)/acetate symporter ActP
MTAVDDLVVDLNQMPQAEKKQKVKELKDAGLGLFSFDEVTRRLVWGGVFAVLLAVVVGAFMMINQAMSVDMTTTTTAANTVTSTTHPDMSAAWAAVAAVVAGVVGILVPSPASSS